jgi:hypothetical protein
VLVASCLQEAQAAQEVAIAAAERSAAAAATSTASLTLQLQERAASLAEATAALEAALVDATTLREQVCVCRVALFTSRPVFMYRSL